MISVMDEIYVGMGDDYYAYFIARAEQRLNELENARLAEENKKEQLAKNREEMKHIIESLEKKVDDLVSAEMLDEADIVLQKIQKYTSS